MDFFLCEIVEARNVEDAHGYPCTRIARAECLDCRNKICEYHADTCEICYCTFCIPCLISHQAEHSKLPATSDVSALHLRRKAS